MLSQEVEGCGLVLGKGLGGYVLPFLGLVWFVSPVAKSVTEFDRSKE